jgi:hypothetical protein
MLSNLDDTSFIPISLTYTEDTDDNIAQNYVLKSWLERFRFDHEHLYKSSLPSLAKNYFFPQPLIVLIDNHRETPLNNSALLFFNNETFKEVGSFLSSNSHGFFSLVYHANLFIGFIKNRLSNSTRTNQSNCSSC